jgi:tetratricopeptide (TPR) repeat protein
MRLSRQILILFFALALSGAAASAQEAPEGETPPEGARTEAGAAESAPTQAPAQAAPPAAARPAAAQPAAIPPAAAAAAAAKQDALALFRQGRDLETAGRAAEAQEKFAQSVAICDRELAGDATRIEAYVVKGWSLFRLGRHAEVVSTGQAGLKVAFDARLVEVMGESYYYLGRMEDCLRSLQKYIDVVGETGDRGPTAYFYMGEAYLRLKKYSHADMAYSLAVSREGGMPRWWFRLGNACEYLGEWKRADEAYAKAVSLSPAYKEALDARERVKPKLAQP